MRIEVKAWAAILGTLIVGIAIGLLLNGALEHRRQERVETMRRPGGFVEEMERVIQPRDAAQRDSLRPYLEATDQRNREIVEGARGAMRAEIDSLRSKVDKLLDNKQKARLADFAQRGPQQGPGRPGQRPFGGPRDGPPPEGAGPPGLEGGPPPPPPRR
jgi:uncharacterized membrane protein